MTKRFDVTIEMSWESSNSEIAEREIINDLNKIFDPGDYIVHVEDNSRIEEYLDDELDRTEGH